MVWKGWVSDVRRYIITLWELRIKTTVYRVLFSSLLVMNLFKLPLICRVYSFIYLFICSCICLVFFFIYLIIYLFIFNPFIVHSFTYNFIYLFICLWSLFSFHFQMFIYIYISIKGLLASTDERRIRRAGELRVGKWLLLKLFPSPIAVFVRSTFLSTDRDPSTNLSQIWIR